MRSHAGEKTSALSRGASRRSRTGGSAQIALRFIIYSPPPGASGARRSWADKISVSPFGASARSFDTYDRLAIARIAQRQAPTFFWLIPCFQSSTRAQQPQRSQSHPQHDGKSSEQNPAKPFQSTPDPTPRGVSLSRAFSRSPISVPGRRRVLVFQGSTSKVHASMPGLPPGTGPPCPEPAPEWPQS